MMIIFAFKKEELKEKSTNSNFSLPIKNPNPVLKTDSGFGFQNWADSGSRIPDSGFGLQTLVLNKIFSKYNSPKLTENINQGSTKFNLFFLIEYKFFFHLKIL